MLARYLLSLLLVAALALPALTGEVEDQSDGDTRLAVTISVYAPFGIADFTAPGERLDVMLIRTIEGQRVSSLVLENVEIIAVDQGASAESSSPRRFGTVTVKVRNRVEAQKLALAQQFGQLSLTPKFPPLHRYQDQPYDPGTFPWYDENRG